MSKPKPVRDEKGQFPVGVSGNPMGRPKGAKNKITLLKQSLELELRNSAAPRMQKVLDKALEMAEEGDRSMIKLLLELHMSKGHSEESAGVDKLQINIGSVGGPSRNTDDKAIDGEVTEISIED